MSELRSNTLKDTFYVSVRWRVLDALVTNFNTTTGTSTCSRWMELHVPLRGRSNFPAASAASCIFLPSPLDAQKLLVVDGQ